MIYKEHILAHYYLACCTSKLYKYESYHSFLYLYKIIEKRDEIIENRNNLKIDTSQLELFDKIYEEDKKLDASSLKGGKWMTDGIKQQYVKKHNIEYFKSLGYHIGKLPWTQRQYDAWKKLVQNNTGKHLSKEWRDNISKANLGRKMSKESREKISKSLQGNTPWNKGLTKETDGRVAKNIKNGFERTQFKKGNIPWNKGKKFSDETRKKMSESAKRRYSNEKNSK